MKRYAIVFFNIIICMTLAFGIIAYAGIQRNAAHEQAEKNLAGTTEIICGITDNYFVETESVCSTWATYINDSAMTMAETLQYLNTVRIRDDVYAQVIWADDMIGLSRESYLSNPDRFDVDYSGRRQLFEAWTDRSTLFVTPRFTNPVTGAYGIAFCRQVNLLENGQPRPAILMRIIQNDYLRSRWIFPSGYSEASIAIIDENGKYVLKPDSMKNEDFFSFLYSYNQGEIDQAQLEQQVRQNKSGLITAKNAVGKTCLWSFRHLDTNEGWTAVMAVPQTIVTGSGPDWFMPMLILVTLLVLFSIDMYYFAGIRRHDRQVQEQLREQGEQLQVALEGAEYANKAKTTFLNNMSHDIRTPMNAILGFTNLAASRVEDTALVKDYLNKIQASGEHLLSLINDVLDMSRIESGTVEIEEKEASLPAILQDIQNILQLDMKRKQLTFEVTADAVTHNAIICDKLRLNQILINLLSNAVKFTEPGGRVRLQVTEVPGAPEGRADFAFLVSDNGIGMGEEFAAHIFEPFTREKNSTVSRIEGTGLGMAITKHIVDLMGGTITVKSEKGKGTDFTVALRFKLVDEQPAASEPSAEAKTPAESIDTAIFAGKRVLLVDDVELNREIAAAVLEEVDILVETAVNGREAVDMVAASQPGYYDLVLMDVMMPEMDGYAATRTIRHLENEALAGIPIIAMTANAFDEDRRASFEAGMNAHISKPFRLDELYSCMKQYLAIN
ncbi:MAG: ATP-binding protein [Lachnospiraceae bacterium]|nr:ATP-binding protein [Lachnospiraceae bacterium]